MRHFARLARVGETHAKALQPSRVAPVFDGDQGLQSVMSRFATGPGALLGYGSEAVVLALDDKRALRVLREGADPAVLRARQGLVDELAARGAPFLLPELEEVGEFDGRWYGIERRLPGRPVTEVLPTLMGHERDLLVERYMDATAALGDLYLAPRAYWGELIGEHPLRAETWPAYLRSRATQSLRRSGLPLRGDGPADLALELAAGLPNPDDAAFVHLDAFGGNVLVVGTSVTAVIDIGVTGVAGDRRLDPLSALVYLSAPEITPEATSRDAQVAMSWLRSAGLDQWLLPVRDWLAAYWSFAVSDKKLHEWCQAVLGGRG